jgi:hypothetical protein
VDGPDGGSPRPCTEGERRCSSRVDACRFGTWETVDDCAGRGLVCAPTLLACTKCIPDDTRCAGANVERCLADGSGFEPLRSCNTTPGVSCRDGHCVNLCSLAREQWSNVGCEYWAVDLDNADIDDSLDAAAQQFSIVVSNADLDIATTVTVEQDDTEPGSPNQPTVVASATIPPLSLRVFRLGPREVDGSPPGKFNAGTNTALTRAAYRLKSTVPIIAYQFNPLENVNVFSNDASLLKPVESLKTGGGLAPSYVVLGWPQTIAVTDDPQTNFSGSRPLHLRAFLTLVGTKEKTHVRVHTRAAIVPGGPIAATEAGGTVDFSLEPFDVMNLETGSFGADFTGSVVETDGPVVVFSGTEASDAPAWKRIGDRRCCADHLEEQLDPVRTAGKRFVAVVSPNRTDALIRAGADSLGHFDAPEFFRVAAATERGAVVSTTLPAPLDRIELSGLGDFAEITSKVDFTLDSTEPVSLASVSPSQGAAGIPGRLPGGDPSLLIIPPIEQFRANYVFLLPDKYSFDFIRIVAPKTAKIRLDDTDVTEIPDCASVDVPTLGKKAQAFVVYRCQMSFPVLDLAAAATVPLSPGIQNDGVHQIVATDKVGVIVDGFDRNVSYAYAAGTELNEIVAR